VSTYYRYHDGKLLLDLHVQTRTHHDESKGLLDDRLCPIPKLLALLAKEFKVSKSQAELIKGAQTRSKCIARLSPAILPDWFLELGGKSQEG